MESVTYSRTRRNLAAVMDKAEADRAPVMITRPRGENVVLIAESEWAGLMRLFHPASSATEAYAEPLIEHAALAD